MLLLLLLISQVTCDWVEIAQNTYKKEPPRRTTPIKRYEERPKDDRVFRNSSILEKQWNKASVDRVFNIGNIKRVHDPSVRTSSINIRPNKFSSTKLSDTTNLNIRRIDSEHPLTVRNPFYEEEIPTKWRETTHVEVTTRPSKIDSIKKLQTINSNVDNFKFSSDDLSNGMKTAIFKDRYDTNKGSDENKIYKEIDENENFGTITDSESSYSASKNDDDDDLYEYRIKNFQRLPTTVQNSQENYFKTKNYFDSTTPVAKTTIDALFNKDNTNYFQKIEKFKEDLNESSGRNDFKVSNTSTKTKSIFHVTKVEKPYRTSDSKINQSNSYSKSNFKDSSHIDLDTYIPKVSIKSENLKENKTKEDFVDKIDKISNTTKGESMGKMWNLVKIVTDIIYKNTHRSFKSKVNYLEGLKSTILTSIEEHFENVFPDDIEHRGYSRRTRSSEARGHVEFPSSESTLMTISFLTFAVFLIKLVLQVIHTYKNKTMMVTPTVVAAVGRAAAAIRSRS